MRNPFKMSLVAAVLTFSATLSYAQPPAGNNFSFSWGDMYKLPKKHQDLGFIGNAGSGYVQLSHRQNKSLVLQKFDAQLHLINEKKATLNNLPKGYISEQFLQVGSKYFWMFSTWERSTQTERLFTQEYDISKNTLVGNAREILSADKLTGDMVMTGFYQYSTSNKWNFFPSFDSSKILIQYRKKPEVRDDSRNKDIIGFQVFDSDMNKIWGREIRMPYTEEKMDNADYQVDREGNIFTLAKVYDDVKKKKSGYHYEVLRWSQDRQEVQIIPFRLNDKYVNSAVLTEDPQGSVIVGGYYSSKKNAVSADGFFMLKVDASAGELVNVKKGLYEFPAETIKEFEGKRTRKYVDKKEKGDKAEVQNLELRQLNINSDGSVQVFGEEYLHVSYTYTTYNGKFTSQTTVNRYYYSDIFALQINADGDLDWVKKIPKSQKGTAGIGDMSFKEFSYNGQHYFFFLDNARNADIKPSETPVQHIDRAGGVLMAVQIDAAGGMRKAAVYDTREEKRNISVTDFSNVGNNQMIVRTRAKKGKSQVALITF